MSNPLTNIRVFVQWTEQTVFAGEDIECQITFKNVATTPTPSRTTLHPASANGFAPGGERQRKGPSTQSKNSATSNHKPLPPNRGHRATLSLNAPVGVGRPQPSSRSWTEGPPKVGKDGSSHKRSVSIISIGASEGAVDDGASHSSLIEGSRRIPRGHGRSASLQIVPRRQGINGGPPSGRILTFQILLP
jgi:hypothetical protein